MSKAILVLDIDEKLFKSNVSSISFENRETIFFMKDIKLKPIPKKRGNITLTERTQDIDMIKWQLENLLIGTGWNACIDEILGEE